MLNYLYSIAVLSAVYAAPESKLSISMPNGRIVGGEDADIKDFPWQVSVQDANGHMCGGSLISSEWVLTAAHCITDGFSGNLSVRVGSTNKSSGGEKIDVSKYIVHDLWQSEEDTAYDIALLQLSSSVTDSIAKSVNLPEQGAIIAAGTNVTVTGWGLLKEIGQPDNSSPEILQKVQVPIVGLEDCNKAYTTSRITEKMLCAGLLGIGGKDACQGDSGGPLVEGSTQYGIVSSGAGCAEPNYPGIYTAVSMFRDWIEQNSGI